MPQHLPADERAAYAEVQNRGAWLGPVAGSPGFAWIVSPTWSIEPRREIAWLAALDPASRMLELREIERGDLSSVAVCRSATCADVAAMAMRAGEPYAILCHRHPSGRAGPSVEDRDLTLRVASALERRRVRLLDHVILGHDQHFSFLAGRVLTTPRTL